MTDSKAPLTKLIGFLAVLFLVAGVAIALGGDGDRDAVGNRPVALGDVRLIDGLGPNGAAWASLKSGGRLSRLQSGYVYHYAFVMLLGVAGLLAFAFSLAS